jgi:hypothetical protein
LKKTRFVTKTGFFSFKSMIVVNPDNTEHTFKIIPRYYPESAFQFDLYNEVTQVTQTIPHTFDVTDGIMEIEFEREFSEQEKFQIKLEDANGIIFRGKMIATSQEPQEYKQTNDLYVYE